MAKEMLKEVRPHVVLFRDTKTGIAWVEDGSTGCGHSAHPNIDSSGSVAGMISLGTWSKEDVCVESHGFIYNTSHGLASDDLDRLAREHCQCGGNH